MTWSAALALGAVVGLGVAMPLGAIGVLLVQTGMARGWRPAAAGGLGVATVDLAYAVLAVLAGSAVSGALDGHERAVRWVGAVVLAAVALHGVLGMRKARTPADAAHDAAHDADRDAARDADRDAAHDAAHDADRDADRDADAAAGVGDTSSGDAAAGAHAGSPGSARGGPGGSYLRFLGLTAVNPLTIVYFTAVVAGLGDRVATTADRVAFVVGIGVASAGWQAALAGVGAVLGARVSARVGTILTGAGYAVVGGFAVALAVG